MTTPHASDIGDIQPDCGIGCLKCHERIEYKRGQCTRCYQRTRRAVKIGKTTWNEQVSNGWAKPQMVDGFHQHVVNWLGKNIPKRK